MLFRDFSLMAEVLVSDLSVKEARKAVRKRRPRGGVRFAIGFLPWILLGILTLGVMLLWEVLPSMAVAYFRYCRQLKENGLNIDSEE